MTSRLDLSKIYHGTRMRRKLAIPPSMLTNKIEDNILTVLRKEVEGKVVPEGFVEQGSVKIKDHGPLMTEVIRFRGAARVDVTFVANICNPTKGDIIECEVKRFNQFGVLATAGPLNIVILENTEPIRVGQILKVRVINRVLLLNDNQINVYSRLASSQGNEEVISDEDLPINPEDITDIDDEKSEKENRDVDDLDDEEDEDKEDDIDNIDEEEDDEQEGGYDLKYNIKDEEEGDDYEGDRLNNGYASEKDEDGNDDEDNDEEEEDEEESSDDEYLGGGLRRDVKRSAQEEEEEEGDD